MSEEPSKNRTPSRSVEQTLQPPPEIPDHELLRLIGYGSYGQVWLARDVMGFFRAIKIVHRSSFKEERPYEREFEGIRRFEPVSHFPSQVNISHVGRNDREGYFYYVMELADDRLLGQEIDPTNYEPRTLRSDLKLNGRLPVSECIEIGLALAAALSHLHSKRLVHRDVKPSNVIFVNGQAKLADIGLVAEARDDLSFVGTEGYVAPEGPGGVQADIFALGKVLYQISTGRGAADYPSLPSGETPPPELLELNQVVNRACEANPVRRYKSVDEVVADLEFLKSAKSLVRVRRLERRVKMALVSSAVLALILVFGVLITGLLVLRKEAAFQKQQAASHEKEAVLQEQMRQIMEFQLPKFGLRNGNGWFSNVWSSLKQASAIRRDAAVLERAQSVLAGLDARMVMMDTNATGTSAAFNNEGMALVGGTGNSNALLFDCNGTKKQLAVRGEGPVCWAPDGTPLQLQARTNSLVLLDAAKGSVRWQFSDMKPGSTWEGAALAITPDGRRVVAASRHRVLAVDTATSEKLGEAEIDSSALALNADGSLLAIGGADGVVRVFELPGLSCRRVLEPTTRAGPIEVLAFVKDPLIRYRSQAETNSWLLAAAASGPGIVVWDLNRGLPRSLIQGANWRVKSLASDPEGLTLVSAWRGQSHVWDVMSGRHLLSLSSRGVSDCRALAFNTEGNRILQGCDPSPEGFSVTLWELEYSRGIKELRGLTAPIRQIWFSSDSRWVAALSDAWQVGFWDAIQGRLHFVLEAPVGVYADSAGGAFDSRSETFAFATGHEACLYDVANGRTLRRWSLPEGLFEQLQFDGNGRLLLLRGEPKQWRLYELGKSDTPILLAEQQDRSWGAYGMALVPGGKRFLVWNDAGNNSSTIVYGYDVTGKELWRGKTTGSTLRIDPSGRRFAYVDAGTPDRFSVMDCVSFARVSAMPLEWEAFSPTGQGLVGNGWLWSNPEKPQRSVPVTLTDRTRSYVRCFSPDGKLVGQGTDEGILILSDIAEVRGRLSELPEPK